MKTHIDNLEKVIADRCYVEYMEGVTQEQLLNLGYKVALSSEGKREIRDLMQRYADERVREFVEFLIGDELDADDWGYQSQQEHRMRLEGQLEEFINQNTESEEEKI